MGQDQSNIQQQQPSSSSSPTNPGVSSSFSFLARLSTKPTPSSQIVVVNANGAAIGEAKDDEDLKRIKEIPRFFPILKGVLPAFRDSPEILTRIEPKYIHRFLHRLQFHFSVCSQTVSSEQSSIYTQIVEVDQLILSLLRSMSLTGKRYDHFTAEMKKAELLNEQLNNVQHLLQEIVPGLILLNELLPTSERLPPLQLPSSPKPTKNIEMSQNTDSLGASLRIVPAQEFSVVDKKP